MLFADNKIRRGPRGTFPLDPHRGLLLGPHQDHTKGPVSHRLQGKGPLCVTTTSRPLSPSCWCVPSVEGYVTQCPHFGKFGDTSQLKVPMRGKEEKEKRKKRKQGGRRGEREGQWSLPRRPCRGMEREVKPRKANKVWIQRRSLDPMRIAQSALLRKTFLIHIYHM